MKSRGMREAWKQMRRRRERQIRFPQGQRTGREETGMVETEEDGKKKNGWREAGSGTVKNRKLDGRKAGWKIRG